MRFRGPPALEGGVASFPHGITGRPVRGHLPHGRQQAFLIVIYKAGPGILDHFR